MQQSQQFGDDDNEGAGAAQMEAMTRLTDRAQMANFLTYGKWNLDAELIEKLKKDEERKERVSGSKWQLWQETIVRSRQFRRESKVEYWLADKVKESLELSTNFDALYIKLEELLFK